MTTTPMKIKKRVPSGSAVNTLKLTNSDKKSPDLRSIDVLRGGEDEETTGAIVDGLAWVMVSSGRFDAINAAAHVGLNIALVHSIKNQVDKIRNVVCPYAGATARIEAKVSALAQKQIELQQELIQLVQRQGEQIRLQQIELQREHENRLLTELQSLRTDLAQLIGGGLPINRNSDVRALVDGAQKNVGGSK